MNVTALIPAHNERDGIEAAITGLRTQTRPPDRIIVIADNCTDETADIAHSLDVEVIETVGNTAKKAGALNYALALLLPDLPDDDVILVQDADSALDQPFIEHALIKVEEGYGAVGGVFRGDERKGFIAHLQRNEYARYARDVARLGGKCLVVTGTAALFRARMLREVSAARLAGTIPPGDGNGGVYDTTVLTEDNELSFAVMHLGYRILSPKECTLVTETMPTWGDLWKQRLRWKRGAVENCIQYGFTRITWRYWGRQALTAAGVLVTFIYLATLIWAIATGGFHLHPFWAGVTLVFVIERVVTVRYRGWKYMLPAALMYELVLDLFLQVCHARAYFDALTRRARAW